MSLRIRGDTRLTARATTTETRVTTTMTTTTTTTTTTTGTMRMSSQDPLPDSHGQIRGDPLIGEHAAGGLTNTTVNPGGKLCD